MWIGLFFVIAATDPFLLAPEQTHGVVLVADHGRVLSERAYGMANIEWSVKHTKDTRFRLCSITKAFVAVAIRQQLEAGTLNSTTPVSTILPELKHLSGVTIPQLLRHTSGLPQPPAALDTVFEPDALPKWLLDAKPEGTAFSYNNADYIVLSALLEKVTGLPLAEALKKWVFDPAGMKQTFIDTRVEPIPQLASGYELVGGKVQMTNGVVFANYRGAGAAVGTARDLFLFDRALASGKLLKPESLAAMYEAGPMGYAEGSYAFTQTWDKASAKLIVRPGGISGFGAQFVRLPDRDGVVVVLQNVQDESLFKIYEKKGVADFLLRTLLEPRR